MRTEKLPPSFHRVLGRYIRAFSPERIVLFGSYAKSSQRPGSDIDLLIVTNFDPDVEDQYLRRARQLAADCFPAVDVVLVTPEQIANVNASSDAFLFSVLQRGITVYERASTQSRASSSVQYVTRHETRRSMKPT